jgi:hypothetical protein
MHYFETQVNKIDVIALLDEFNSSDNTRHTCLSTLILSLLQPHYAILDVIEPILHVQTPIHVYEMSMEKQPLGTDNTILQLSHSLKSLDDDGGDTYGLAVIIG